MDLVWEVRSSGCHKDCCLRSQSPVETARGQSLPVQMRERRPLRGHTGSWESHSLYPHMHLLGNLSLLQTILIKIMKY